MSDFEDFYRDEFPSIAVIAGTTAGSRGLGEDLAQEAFAQAAQRWPEISQLDRPGAWVRRVAINMAISRRRRFSAEARALLRLDRPQQHDLSEHRFGRSTLWEAVDRLSPRQRAVIALKYLEERTVAEIADILEISVSATTSHLHAARRSLATDLEGTKQ